MDLDSSQKFSYSHMNAGPSEGSNYYIPIWSTLIPGKLAAIMWFLDSHNHGCMGNQQSYGCIEQDQIMWFEETMT